MLSVAMAWSFSDDNAIFYVFPVLRMTSCFYNGPHGAWRWQYQLRDTNVGGAVLKQLVKIFNIFTRGRRHAVYILRES